MKCERRSDIASARKNADVTRYAIAVSLVCVFAQVARCETPDQADSDRHWSFIAPSNAALPQVRDVRWPRNPIDYFVLQRLEEAGLRPSPPAAASTLIRRLFLDLTGLPPAPDQVDAYINDSSPGAYERQVDQRLSSPAFGEHMAVAWLDAARYADTNGYNNDTPRYNWRYRDWVIDAFNRNLPYDEFITEQLAGDLLPAATLEQKIATGFNRNHNVTSEGGIIDEEYRLEYVADRVQTTATVFLALTMRCARCHDHKFDPISQREYYQFFAFFNQVPETGYHKEHIGNPQPVISAPTRRQQVQLTQLSKQLAEVDQEIARKTIVANDQDYRRLVDRRNQLSERHKELTESIPTAMVMRDTDPKRETFLLLRGAYDQPVDEVRYGTPRILPPFSDRLPANRFGFTQWLVQPEHPLTARVAVNRLWQQVFGSGLVETLEDFGTRGSSPSHPELLDWLALELVRGGWNVKHMLRLMVTSQTYRQTSRVSSEQMAFDPVNRLLGRAPRFRLTGEMIRDGALAASGLLQQQLGGPSVRPYQPAGLWTEVSVADDSYSGGPYKQDHGSSLYRRGVYTWWKRTCPPPSLNTLDAPDREFCRVRRSRTNTPLQALVLMNDPTFVEAARAMAQAVWQLADGDDQAAVALAFRRATARRPTARERELLCQVFVRQRERFAADGESAARLLAVGESPVVTSLQPADLAALTTVCNMILNLDEVLTK